MDPQVIAGLMKGNFKKVHNGSIFLTGLKHISQIIYSVHILNFLRERGRASNCILAHVLETIHHKYCVRERKYHSVFTESFKRGNKLKFVVSSL